MNRKKMAPYLFILPAGILIIGLMIFPILFSVYLSVQKYMLNLPVNMVKFNGLDNYRYIFSNKEFLGSISWTLVFTVVVVSIELVVGIWLAVLINEPLVKRRAVLFRTLLVMPMMLSPVISGVIWRILFEAKYGVVNFLLNCIGLEGVNWLAEEIPSKLSLIISEVWHNTPFVMLIFFAALQTVPEEFIEAAIMDGANAYQRFFRITIPYLRNFLALIVSVRLMDALRYFDEIFVLTKGGPGTSTQTVGYTIYRLAFRYSNVGAGSAGAMVFLILIIMVSLLSMRLIKGKPEKYQ